jgi:hypothetical protein
MLLAANYKVIFWHFLPSIGIYVYKTIKGGALGMNDRICENEHQICNLIMPFFCTRMSSSSSHYSVILPTCPLFNFLASLVLEELQVFCSFCLYPVK